MIKIKSVTNYSDIWGNEQDGYTVNDAFHYDIDAIIADSGEAILNFLMEQGFISIETQLSDIEIEDGTEQIFINEAETFKPLFAIYFDTMEEN